MNRINLLLVSKTSDDFLASVMNMVIESFFVRMKTRFEVCMAIISPDTKFNMC